LRINENRCAATIHRRFAESESDEYARYELDQYRPSAAALAEGKYEESPENRDFMEDTVEDARDEEHDRLLDLSGLPDTPGHEHRFRQAKAEERGEQGFGKAAPAPKDIYAVMTLGDFKLDRETLQGAKVEIAGELHQMGELATLGSGLIDRGRRRSAAPARPIWPNGHPRVALIASQEALDAARAATSVLSPMMAWPAIIGKFRRITASSGHRAKLLTRSRIDTPSSAVIGANDMWCMFVSA
jgi:hypothetical protein